MKLIPDRTGRFPERPHYDIDELEEQCERIITNFLEQRYGQIVIPVPTDALRVLIEGEAAKLLHADLSHEGEEVHGITEFFPGCKPRVSIARELSSQPWRVHRERTTLAHEYGHVHWHTPLYDPLPAGRTAQVRARPAAAAYRSERLDGVAGRIRLGRAADAPEPGQTTGRGFRAGACSETPAQGGSVDGQILIGRVSELFDVSREAAEVRLLQIGHLTPVNKQRSCWMPLTPGASVRYWNI